MTIGIAIPTYVGHINYLNKLLYTISKSSLLPTQVSVSISSFEGELNFEDYPFELIITKTLERKNPSQNRNIAASKLTTDIISFIDGDDLPHHKRNEYILSSFQNECNCVVHNYFQNSDHGSNWFESQMDTINYHHNYIDSIIDGCPFALNSDISNHRDYHCAHISIKKEIFDKIKFDESENIVYSEDSEYTKKLIKNDIKISYLSNRLSQYNK
jgi:hypothetical protein